MSSWRVLQRRYCEQLVHQLSNPPPVVLRQRCYFPPSSPSTRSLQSRYHQRSTAYIVGGSRTGPKRWASSTAVVVVDESSPAVGTVSETTSTKNRKKSNEDSSSAPKAQFRNEGVGDPLDQLRIFYKTTYGKTISIRRDPNLFQRIRVQYENSSRIAWSAVFTCPVTKETMASGTLIDWDDPPVASDNESVVAYSKWKTAQQAAVGAFLDGVQLASTGHLGPRFCEETPRSIVMPASTVKVDKVAPEMTPIARLHREFPKTYDGRKINNRHIAVLSVPSGELSLENEEEEEDESSLVLPSMLWSAVITCPLSGTKFPSSIYRNNVKTEYWVDVDDIVYYAQKKEAIHSAAARFLDAIEYRNNGDDYDESGRLCSEHPSLLGDSLLKMDSNIAAVVDEIESEEGELSSDSDEASSSKDEEEVSEEETGEEDSYLPGIEGPLSDEEYFVSEVVEVSGEQTPADWLLEAADKAVADRKALSSQMTHDPAAVLEIALDFISSLHSDWNKRPPISIHQLKLGEEKPKVKLFRAKTILLALGDSVCVTPMRINKVHGVRAVANKILSLLWKMEEGRPDADLYALYVRCHDDRNLGECIASVSRLIADMNAEAKVEATEHRLPKPNMNTLNAFIQLNAQRGGTDGRFADHSELLQPNRQSFLAVLSSAIYDPLEQTDAGGFDPEFARDCIDRMNEIFLETKDSSMKPDTQVYNAPLRWASGPKLWLASRPYARSVPWDNYREIYKHGLRSMYSVDDLRIQEAQRIGSWIDAMKRKAAEGEPTHPNIETYEALMQAWLRTATRKGLDEADQVFHKLIEDDSGKDLQVRLQTLHPLLASWYHSDSPDRWSKISALIGAWENYVGHEHVLDARLMELKLLALISTPDHQTKTLQQATSAANEVTGLILNYISKNNTPANHFLFEKAMIAWEDVAGLSDGILNTGMIEQIEAIFTLFEKNMRDATKSQLLNDDSGIDKGPTTLMTMCEKAPLVYGSIVNVLSKTVNLPLSPSDNHKISILLSRVIRCFVETRAILKQSKSQDTPVMSYSDDDHFSYRLVHRLVRRYQPDSSRQEDVLWNIMGYFSLKGLKQPGNVSDLVTVYYCSSDFQKNQLKNKSGALLDRHFPGISKRLQGLFFQEDDDGEHEDKRRIIEKPQRSLLKRKNWGVNSSLGTGRTKPRPNRKPKHRASARNAQ